MSDKQTAVIIRLISEKIKEKTSLVEETIYDGERELKEKRPIYEWVGEGDEPSFVINKGFTSGYKLKGHYETPGQFRAVKILENLANELLEYAEILEDLQNG
jgi:hypothetical protein